MTRYHAAVAEHINQQSDWLVYGIVVYNLSRASFMLHCSSNCAAKSVHQQTPSSTVYQEILGKVLQVEKITSERVVAETAI